MIMSYHRRTFIKHVTTAAALVPFRGFLSAGDPVPVKERFPIRFFSKPLDGYEPLFMVETLAMAGIEGLDVTVRPGGRIEPERVADDLPEVVGIGNRFSIRTAMMVTAITGVEDPYAREVLAVASNQGISHYRMGYMDYDYQLGIWETLASIKERFARLAVLNQELGIQAGYQNHAGTRVGAPAWDIWELIRELPPEWMSNQFDVRHAAVEGASAWTLSMRLLSNHIGSLAIKDYNWEVLQGKLRDTYVPLGEGLVDFDQYFRLLGELKIEAPITLHIEYPLLEKEEEGLTLLQKQRIMVPKIRKDLDFIRSYLAKYQLV